MNLYKNDGKVLRSISSEAKEQLIRFKEDYLKEDNLIENDCLCGSKDKELISQKDKYAIPLQFVICKKCGLIRIDPYLSENTLNYFYENVYRNIKDTQVDKLFAEQEKKGSKIHNFINQDIDFNQIKQVIEIGCGAGGILYYFEKLGKKTLGFDYDKKFLDYGNSKGLNLHFGNALEELPKYELENSIIVINHVVEHILDVKNFIKKLETIVPIGIYIYISVPGTLEYVNRYYPNNLYKFFIFAHPWNFDLNSFKYNLLNNSKFKSIKEDEDIRILIKKVDKEQEYINNCRYYSIKFNLYYLKARETLREFVKKLAKNILK